MTEATVDSDACRGMRGLSPTVKKAFLCLLIALLALLIGVTARQGLADFHTVMAGIALPPGANAFKPQTEEAAARVQRHLDAALELAPDSAWALYTLTEWKYRTSLSSIDRAIWEDAARVALEGARRLVRQRPAYPQSWARLASLKGRLGQHDDEFWTALKQAETLGPWKTDVLLAVMAAGLPVWAQMDDGFREHMRGVMERAARRSPDRAAVIAAIYKRLDVFCALDTVKARKVKACVSAASSRKTVPRK